MFIDCCYGLYCFSRLVVVDSPLIPMISPALRVNWVSNTRHGFSLVAWILNPIRELLITDNVSVPLLNLYGYCALLIDVILWFIVIITM